MMNKYVHTIFHINLIVVKVLDVLSLFFLHTQNVNPFNESLSSFR